MRKRNNVKQLNKNSSHRKAMLRNMVTSFFEHERVSSTKARIKVLQPLAERLITRAKKAGSETNAEAQLHHKRELLKVLRSRSTMSKLIEDIAPRYNERNGGYTRMLRLVNRASDNSEMAMLELIDRKEEILIQEERRERKLRTLPKKKREKVSASIAADKEASMTKKEKKEKKKKEKKKKEKKKKKDEE